MGNPLPDLSLRDIIDIAVVTIIVYSAVVWIRRTRAASVAGGIAVLGGLYLIARALDLRLTMWIFQGFFAVLLIVVVIIFQDELRQLFERLALGNLRKRRSPMPASAEDVLVRSLAELARRRCGALVVIPGRQPLGRYLDGGQVLDGKLSSPLLESIFDSSSAGHDGAVVVEGERVTRFAAHLPLSKDFGQIGGHGTRHSAALGLAERTDALCIVVSEEHGTISVGQRGVLRRLEDPAELKATIASYRRDRHPERSSRSQITRFLRENWMEKVLSILMVFGLWWVLVSGSRPTTRTYSVPVSVVNLDLGLRVADISPDSVEARFTGLARDFYWLHGDELSATIDGAQAQRGTHTYRIDPEDLRYPDTLRLEQIHPDRVQVELRRVAPTPTP